MEAKRQQEGSAAAAASGSGAPKRRHHRRAKKRKAPRNPDGTMSGTDQPQAKHNPPLQSTQSSSQSSLPASTVGQQSAMHQSPTKKSHKRRCRKRRSGPAGGAEGGRGHSQGGQHRPVLPPPALQPVHNNLVLRPTRGPPAPQNSTQYIIEDHVVDDSDSNPEVDAIDDENGNDDDRVWDEFSERDFQNVYESAHREEVAEWDKDKLISEIVGMEKKHKELMCLMQRMDPDVYLEHLMTRATTVMEKNRLLKLQQQMGIDSRLKTLATSTNQQPDGATSPGTLTVTSTAVEDDQVASTSNGTSGNFSPPVQA